MPEKPHIFLPADVVKTISHGRLNATGIQSVLDALYVQEHEPGCCGMDTETLLEPCFLSRHQTSLAGATVYVIRMAPEPEGQAHLNVCQILW